MNFISKLVIWSALLVTLYGLVAIIVVIRSVLNERYRAYQEKYDEYLAQRQRVQNKLKRRGDELGI